MEGYISNSIRNYLEANSPIKFSQNTHNESYNRPPYILVNIQKQGNKSGKYLFSEIAKSMSNNWPYISLDRGVCNIPPYTSDVMFKWSWVVWYKKLP